MPFLLLLLGFGAWAFLVVPRQNVRHYLGIYFLCCIGSSIEAITLRGLHLYQWQANLVEDPHTDALIASVTVGAGLNPLIGVLYARYCQSYPVLKAILAACCLGLMEVGLIWAGNIRDVHWHPVFTVLAYLIFFAVVRWFAVRRVPRWLHVYGVAVFLAYLIDTALARLLHLFHYSIPVSDDPFATSRLILITYCFVGVAPVVALVSLTERRKWLWGSLAVVDLLLLEAAGVAGGIVVHDAWSLWLSIPRYTAVLALTDRYRRWLVAGD